jgi:uncharacterized protein (DUF362 family)
MRRRAFLKTFSIGLVGSSLSDPANVFSFASENASILSVAKGKDPALIIAEAINALGGMSTFVSRDDVVLVKPNIGWDRMPEHAATTNPFVVAALVELAYKAGAKKVKVFDNTCNSARRCYKRSGIAEAAAGAGAEVTFVENRKFKRVKLNGEVLKEWPVYEDALEVDKIINVPIAKHHSLAGLTLSMKNLMGLVGGARNLLHQKLSTNIIDLAGFFKPTLVVLDAVRILTSNGPQGGNLKDVKEMNLVAASVDQVAIDAFGARLFNMRSDDFAHIRDAYSRGLGEKDLSKVQIIERTLQ